MGFKTIWSVYVVHSHMSHQMKLHCGRTYLCYHLVFNQKWKQLPHPHFVAFLLAAFGRCPGHITRILGCWDTGMSSAVLTALLMLFYECALRFFLHFAILQQNELAQRIAAAIKWTKLSWKCFAQLFTPPKNFLYSLKHPCISFMAAVWN